MAFPGIRFEGYRVHYISRERSTVPFCGQPIGIGGHSSKDCCHEYDAELTENTWQLYGQNYRCTFMVSVVDPGGQRLPPYPC